MMKRPREGRSSSRKSIVESAAHVTPVQIFEAAGSFVAVAAASFFRGARAPPLTERPRQRIRRVRRAVAPPGTLLVCARPHTFDHTLTQQQKGDGFSGLDSSFELRGICVLASGAGTGTSPSWGRSPVGALYAMM